MRIRIVLCIEKILCVLSSTRRSYCGVFRNQFTHNPEDLITSKWLIRRISIFSATVAGAAPRRSQTSCIGIPWACSSPAPPSPRSVFQRDPSVHLRKASHMELVFLSSTHLSLLFVSPGKWCLFLAPSGDTSAYCFVVCRVSSSRSGLLLTTDLALGAGTWCGQIGR